MKQKSKSILKCIMTFVLIVAMVMGALPLDGLVMVEGGNNYIDHQRGRHGLCAVHWLHRYGRHSQLLELRGR